MNTRGPVIFASLYTAGVILTILALMMHERFGETAFRSWAPLLQAALSAGAIFAAWWLQNRKRESDRADLRADAVTMLLQHALHVEYALSRSVAAVRAGGYKATGFEFALETIDANLAGMRDIDLAKLPDAPSIRAAMIFIHNAAVAAALMRVSLKRLEPDTIINTTLMDGRWKSVYESRTRLLNSLGATPEPSRTANPEPFPTEQPGAEVTGAA